MKKIKAFSKIILAISLIIYKPVFADNPVANSSAVVKSGEVRFTILTSRMIRMEWSANKIFEDRASQVFINRNLSVPKFTIDDQSDLLVIKTDYLTLQYKKNSGKFTPDNLSITFMLNGNSVAWKPGMKDSLNLKGTTRTLDGTNGEKDVRLEDGLISKSGWSLVDDSNRLLFDGAKDWNWITPRNSGDYQDFYFFGYGHDYKQALYDYTLVAGKIPMPPKFAFGYWWSRYWTYSDSELRTLVNDIKSYDIPIDVLIIDMDWHDTWGITNFGTKRDPFGQSVGWTGYTWNKNLFPNPEKFLKWTDQQKLKTALNLHPASGIAPMEEKYNEFAKVYGFDTTGHNYIPFSIEDKKWTRTYFDVVLHPFEKMGIDFFWLDWQQWLENKKVKGLTNTWWLNYTFFTEMEREGIKRPLLFHRWGGLGNHRYQIGFSGDTYITWQSLSFQPYFTSTAGNVGYGYWSHDIGGHMGGEPTSEMYLRWLQFGVFSPILRTHYTKDATLERRIWKYVDNFELMRDAIQLRYTLNPYIYTSSRKAYDTGVSICRPMYYDYPEQEEAYNFKSQYMFGDDILVAPITEKVNELSGLAEKKIWLPDGDWYELFTGTTLKGNNIIDRKFALNEIPVYVKAGSIIPMYSKINNLQRSIDTLVLTLIPGKNGNAKFYEDDGATSGYTKNQFAWTKVTKDILSDGSMKIVVLPREGKYKDMPAERAYEFCLPSSFPPAEVYVNGKSISYSEQMRPGSWNYIASKLTTSILTAKLPCDKKTEVIIKWNDKVKGKDNLFDGKIGLFGRIPKIIKLTKDEVNLRDGISNAPTPVLKFADLPTRIRYNPEKTVELLQEFENEKNELLRSIINYPRGEVKVLENIISQFPFVSKIAAKPVIKPEKNISDSPAKIEITSSDNSTIHYTLDGTIPDISSPVYKEAITLDKTTVITAKAFKENYLESLPATEIFYRLTAKSVKYENENSSRYSGGSEYALVDGKLGTADNFRNDWVGFSQVDFVATIVLFAPKNISSITARFMQNQGSWIFPPTQVEYEISTDGVNFRNVFTKDLKSLLDKRDDAIKIVRVKADVSLQNVTHIRVKAKNIGVCPAWHIGAGGRTWLFIDEVVVE